MTTILILWGDILLVTILGEGDTKYKVLLNIFFSFSFFGGVGVWAKPSNAHSLLLVLCQKSLPMVLGDHMGCQILDPG